METFERHEIIRAIMEQQGKASVEELCEALNASPATVRRDLKWLEENQMLQRFRGGARKLDASDQPSVLRPLSERLEDKVDEKERIAAKALSLVHEGDVIALTGGSTNIFLARALKDLKNITIVTNCITIASEFSNSPGIEVILIGGKLRYSSMCMVGPLAEEALKKIRISKIFMGVEGIDFEIGITTHNFSEALIDRYMAECSDEVIVVADNTKFGKKLFSDVIPVAKVDKLITNTGMNPDIAAPYEKLGIDCLFV